MKILPEKERVIQIMPYATVKEFAVVLTNKGRIFTASTSQQYWKEWELPNEFRQENE